MKRNPLRAVLPAVLSVLAMFGPDATAQLSITYVAGENNTSPYTLTGANTLTIATGAATQSGAISGSGAIIKTGAGDLTLSNISNYFGATMTVNGGRLSFSTLPNSGFYGPVARLTVNNGTLSASDALAVDGSVTVTGGNSLFSANALRLGAYNNGTLRITNGGIVTANQVDFGGSNLNGTGFITGTGSQLNVSSTLDISQGSYLTVGSGGTITARSLQVRGSGGTPAFFAIDPGGTLELSNGGGLFVGGQDTFRIAGGTLRVTSFASAAPINVSTATSTIETNGVGATLSGVLSGTGTLTKTGAGTLTLSGANTFSGAMTVSAGSLVLDHSLALQNSTLTVPANGGFTFGSVSSATLGGLTGASDLALTNVNSSAVALSVGQNNSSTTYSGVLSGAGALTKSGVGTLTLSGTNTYTGGTTISGGTLALGDGGTTGSIVGNVSNQGSLAFNRSDALTFSGVISGTGILTKTGAGTLTLTATNTYAGGTTISSGALAITSASNVGSGPLTLATGGTLETSGVDPLPVTFNFAGGTLKLSGSSLTAAQAMALSNASTVDTNGLGASLSGVLSGTGSLTKTGAGTLTLSAANTYAGGTTVSGGTLAISSPANLGSGAVTVTGGTLAGTAALSFNRNVSVTGNSASLTTVGYLEFGSTGNGSLTLANGGAATATTSVAFGVHPGATGTGSVTGTGSRLTASTKLFLGYLGTGSLTVASGGTVVAPALAFGEANGAGTLNLESGGTLEIGGLNPITFGAGTNAFNLAGGAIKVTGSALTTNVPATLTNTSTINTNALAATFAGVLSGPGALEKSGAGTVTLTAANTYSGGTTVSAGTLQIGNAGATGSVTGNITNHGTVAFNRSDDYTYNGAISGTGGLTMNGNILRLSSAQTHTGPTSINTGILVLPTNLDQALSASTAVTIASGAGLDISNRSLTVAGLAGAGTVYSFGGSAGHLTVNTAANAPSAFSGTLGGGFVNFSLTKTGTGTLTLSGANTYTGATTLAAGTLALASTGALGSAGPITLGGGTLQFSSANTTDYSSRFSTAANQSYAFDTNGQNITLASALTSNGGTLTKTGTGTLTLSGANTFTGGTSVSGGILVIGNGATSGSIVGNITNNASVAFDRSDGVTFAGTISGSGSLTKAGAGTLTLSAANTYAGGTTVSSGTLVIGNGATSGSITGNVTNNASLAFDRSDAVTFAGAISGSGSLTKTGAGALTLSATNTYTGGTTISAGTLALGDGTTTGALVGSIVNNAALVVNPASAVTLAGNITGSGTLTKIGPGTLTLSGYNQHASTTVSGGTLVVATTNSAGLGPVVVTDGATLTTAAPGSGAISLYNTLTVTNGGVAQLGGVERLASSILVSGSGSRLSSGMLSLGGDHYTNNLTIESGGSASINGGFSLGNPGGLPQSVDVNEHRGILTLNPGGTLETNVINEVTFYRYGPTITAAGSSGAFNLAGGTLKAWPDLGGLTVSIPTTLFNASTIDTNGRTALFDRPLSGSGSLTKTGTGTLTFSAANTYTGATTINAGTLQLSGAGRLPNTSSITVASGATFDVSALAGGFTVGSGQTLGGTGTVSGPIALAAGARLAPGSSASPLTFTSGLTLAAGSVFDFHLGTTSDLIRLTGGTLTGPATGLITFNFSDSGGFAAGTYNLLNYATASGTQNFSASSFAVGTSPAGYDYTFALASNSLNLIATASAIPEPSTYAALAGFLTLAIAIMRKRRTSP